jgi:hypothetical protein
MADICCADDHIRGPQRHGLGRENHVAVQSLVIRSRLTLLPGLGPEHGGLSHRRRGERQILQQAGESIEAGQSFHLVGTQQFPAYFVVRDLWYENAGAMSRERLQLLGAGDTLR